MNSFHRPQRGGGNSKRFEKKNFGRGGFHDRSSGKPSMHRATCSECGNSCEVPFKPTGDRPVFCSNCFKKGGNMDSGNSKSRRFDRDDYEDESYGRGSRSSMYEATCDECGDICEVPFKPSGSKPVFCDNCFKKGGNGKNNSENKNIEQLKEQFEIFNIKLDRILKILTSPPPKETVEVVKVLETKEAKPKKETKKRKKA